MKKLNLEKIKQNHTTNIISTKESLKDVIPIEWSKEVLEGKKKVIVK